MRRILIALNSFKECASSVELSELTKSLFQEKLNSNDFEFCVKPISDGGDGFLETVTRRYDLEIIELRVNAPFDDNKIICPVGYWRKEKTVFIETAKVLGLNLIPKVKRKPLELSSKGFGGVLKTLKSLMDKGEREIKKVIVGVGGTGTSDLGIGALNELGLKLFDVNDSELNPTPENFLNATKIEFDDLTDLPFELEFILDVENDLLGETGANRLFAAQKGANEKEIETLEKGFERIILLIPENLLVNKTLSGAGGGLPSAFKIFYDAKYKSAKEFILNDLSLSSENSNFALVISGEGKLDFQTGLQKGVSIIINEYKNKAPVALIVGSVEKFPLIENVRIIELRKYYSSIEESIKKYKQGLAKAVEEIIASYFSGLQTLNETTQK